MCSFNFLQVIGQEKRALAGFARSAVTPNAGIIYYSELVQVGYGVRVCVFVAGLWL